MAKAVDAADTTTDNTTGSTTGTTPDSTKKKAGSKQHKLPASITDNIRKATSNPCSDLTYG